MEKRKGVIILVTLVLVLLVINYPYLDNSLKKVLRQNQEVHVDRIIDGDTIESNGTSIRLLGINTPERGEFFYSEAKEYLQSLILNKTVMLEFVGERQDKYYRTLAYIWYQSENININLVENGFANYYFYDGKDKYSNALLDAWKTCLNNKINLCELSNNKCASCINIGNNQIINNCSFSCDIDGWVIKGEGREKFVFNSTLSPSEKTNFGLDLSNSGGSLFLRDNKGGLIFWSHS